MGFHIPRERKLFESALRDRNPGRYFADVAAGIKSGHIKPYQINRNGQIERGPDYDAFRSNVLFENFVYDRNYGEVCGRHFADEMRDRRQGRDMRLYESGSAVTSSMFSEINGQIVYSAILDALEGPNSSFMGWDLVTKEQATTQHAEIVPGIGMLGDVAENVGEGEEYPMVGLTSEYITIPEKIKDGFQIPVTEEAAWEDRTGLLLQRANTGVQAMGITIEKEILDTVLGITTSYRRNGGPAQATYANTHTQGDFDNLLASNALVDWTDIEAAELLFDAMTDPNTGEPILIGGMDVIVPTALKHTLRRIVGATEIEYVDNQANASTLRTRSPNPMSGQTFGTFSNQYVKGRTSSDSTWFIGDFKGAFGYAEIWPVTTEVQDKNSQAGFTRDILTVIKTRRKGIPFVREPRKVIKCTQ